MRCSGRDRRVGKALLAVLGAQQVIVRGERDHERHHRLCLTLVLASCNRILG